MAKVLVSEYCRRPACAATNPRGYRINRKSVLNGLTDEYHIAACRPALLQKDAGQHLNRIFEPHRMEVGTTDGYQPGLNEIVRFVNSPA